MVLRTIVAVFAGSLLTTTPARAQSLSAEVDVTVGYSSKEDLTAAATQFRVFGKGRRAYGSMAKAPGASNSQAIQWVRRSGLDTVVRAQGYSGPLIVGVSYMRSLPYMSPIVEQARLGFMGIDARWMLGGIQGAGRMDLRTPYRCGTSTRGWYADLIVHRPVMGPVTAVFRTEHLDWIGSIRSDDAQGRRHTVGARVRLTKAFTVHANVIRQSGYLAEEHRGSVDLAVTYAIRLN